MLNPENKEMMNPLRKNYCFLFLVLFSMPFRIQGQTTEQEGLSKDKIMNAAREIMAAAGTCALITLDDKDLPMVRVMDPFLPEDDLTVWMGTNSRSRKVDQIRRNPNVTLYYLDKDASGYVVIHGLARLVDDKQEKEKRWKEEWAAFYPDKDEGYLLISVSPEWMEVLSYPRGITGDPETWQVPAVSFDLKK